MAMIMFIAIGCREDKEEPTVTTTNATEITSTGANSGGTVTDSGSDPVTSRGVVWSTDPNPTISDSKTTDGAGAGPFTSTITGLEPETKYYLRAYATSEAGTGYGNEIEFTTLTGASAPTVTTAAVTEVDRNTAVSGGEVVSDGGATVTARGICWSTSENPTVDDSKTVDGDGLGEFISNLTELESNTTYYIRAYATNEAGTGYGEQVEFTTLKDGEVVDIDGNVYATVIIGNQEWMAENLRVTNFNNGDPITHIAGGEAWADNTDADNPIPAYTVYNFEHSAAEGLESEQEVIDAYGLHYNWYAVETGNLCPAGWAVPDTTEWNQLFDYLIATEDDLTEMNVAMAVKSCRQIDSPLGGDCDTEEHPRWRADEDHYGDDRTGLGFISSGYILSGSGNSGWMAARGYWWTSVGNTDEDGNPIHTAIFRRLNHSDNEVTKASFNKNVGQPIRCIKK